MCSKGKSNARSYGVNVNVLEGRDLVTNAEHVVVRVMIDSQKRYTHSRSHGYSPHFDEYFLFEFNCTLDELLNKTIRFTVMEPKKRFRSRKTIGEVLLDVALIWDQPISDHFFYHKWTMVTKTQGGNSFLKGYLKIDLSVSTKGTIPQIPKDQSETDEIEGNLLLYNPLSGDYQKALYSFNIYSIQDLDRTSPKHCCQRKDIFIEVYFIGSKLKTSTRSLSNVVEWNEQINFFGLFPPLCQRIRFEIYESCFQKCMATFFLNLRDISNDGENGFLPTFGPSFVYLYNKINEYLGRFLLSVETKTTFQDYGPHEACYTKLISPIETDNFWVNEEIFALCIIVDVSCIDSHFSSDSVGFEISLGRKREQEETSKTLLPVTANKRNHFVLLDRTKPCIYTIATLPNLQMRMFHKNFLEKIYENFSINLDEVETLIYNDENISILQNKFSKTLNEFEVKVKDYLKSEISCNATDLDIYKSRLCIETMKSLLGKSIGIHREKFSRKNFRRTKMMQEKIKLLISQIQECWPDCIISMYHSSKKVAHFRIPCNEICYCDTPVGKGKYCTVKRTIFMQYISTARETIEIPYKFAAKLEIISWLGSYSQRHKCLEELKNLFQQMNKKNENVQFPQALESREINVFQFRAHIYEGRFIPGADKSGLSDPFLRIIIKSLIKKTKTVGGTLNPEWKQTLIINNVVLWGTSKYLSRYPPLVLIEAYDNDKCGNELQGRALVEGSLKFKNEIYKPSKLKWIKITNRGHITGEIFASFELLQVNPDDNTESLTETRIEIPRELLPKLVNQRVEIIFWGVRQLQRTFGCILTKPKITINISNMNLHSTPITNPRQCLNFSNPYVVTDMELPVEKDYAPTLCIQLQDCKSFGRNTYVGVATSNIKNFYYNPRSQSRYNLLKEKPTNFTRLKRYESEHKSLVSENKSMQFGTFKTWCQILHFCGYKRKKVKNSEPYEPLIPNEKKEDEIIDLDWWSKYYASIDGENSEMISGNKDIIPIKMKIKPCIYGTIVISFTTQNLYVILRFYFHLKNYYKLKK